MRRWLMLFLVACGGGGGSPPIGGPRPTPDAGRADGGSVIVDGGRAPDAGVSIDGAVPIDAGDGCAVAPTGDWSGTVRYVSEGTGSRHTVTADLTFTLASTQACIDQYTPSGTITDLFESQEDCMSSPAAIAPGDGALVIDRSTSPATYTIDGHSQWDATVTCAGAGTSTETFDDPWANDDGLFEGDVIDGDAIDPMQQDVEKFDWHLRRVGASFPPPAGCSEPATDTWSFTGRIDYQGAMADVTWTRASTDGCVDTFTPSGTASEATPGCTYDPPSGAIAPGDGVLAIDRSVNPPIARAHGETFWSSTLTCTQPDGTTTTWQGEVGGHWAMSSAAYQGDRVGGGVDTGYGRIEWRLSR